MATEIVVGKTMSRRFLFLCATAFTLFVVYGSLVPFEGRDYSFTQALEMFAGINYLQLGVVSRADWIANALIYMPVGFFWHGYLQRQEVGTSGRLAIFAGLMALIVGVEFLQIFVAPRTVSLNDLVAESIGLLLGYGMWSLSGAKLAQIMSPILNEGRIATTHLLLLYIVFYLLFALFPYDFYISLSELREGLEQKALSFIVGPSESFGLKFVLLRLVDFLIAVPVGLLAYRVRGFRSQWQLLSVIVPALLVIELLQIFMASGTVVLFSVVLKAAGLLLGWQLDSHKPIARWLPKQGSLLKLMTFLVLPYLLVVALIKGWTLPGNVSIHQALSVLADTSFIPFYYHYYVTEVRALISLLVQTMIMAPLGCYLYFYDGQRGKRISFSRLALLAAAFALIFELGVLLLAGAHPDPTNLLIAIVSVWGCYQLTGLIYRSLLASDEAVTQQEQEQEQEQVQGSRLDPLVSSSGLPFTHSSWTAKCLSVSATVAVIVYLIDHPLFGWELLAGVLLSVLMLWRWPASWLILLPAAIPVLDFYVLTGRFFLTELDGLVLLVLALCYWRGFYQLPKWKKDPWLMWLLLGLIVCYLMSIAQTMVPWPGLMVDSFYSFYSPFNALRITKSLLWALLLMPLFNFQLTQNPRALLHFGLGMLAGLLLVFFIILVERALFPGLLNFLSNSYRIKGSFSTMHTGGAHIDAYLLMALPFIAVLLVNRMSLGRIVCATLIFIVTLYAVFVTYSRAPYIATPILCLLMLVGYLVSKGQIIGKLWSFVFVLVLGCLMLFWLAAPFFYNSVLSERIVNTERDKDTRVQHWEMAVGLLDEQGGSYLWGHGPGSLPYQLFLHSSMNNKKIAVHSLREEQGNHILRIFSGDNIYTNQYVGLDVKQDYKLSFKVKSPLNDGLLKLPLCEKWIMESFRCVWSRFRVPKSEDWQLYQQMISLEKFQETLGITDKIVRRPIVLSVYSSGRNSVIDIDEIQLLDETGYNVLKNGGFEQGKDGWYFTADNHMLWHSKNIFVNLYHDFGFVGLILILSLVGLVCGRLLILIRAGNQQAVIFLASLASFFGIGLIGSLFDAPQLSLLFYLLLISSALMWTQRSLQQSTEHQ